MPLTPAEARDAAASRRDAIAEERDCRAMARDRRARSLDADRDQGFAARYLSAVDRDSAAGDRAEALADRRHASDERRASTATQVPPTRPRDATDGAAGGRGRRATATGHGATAPYFSDEPDRPGGLTPTPPSSRLPHGVDPPARLAAMLARRHLVRVAQGMVMKARQVGAEEASRLLLEAMDLRGHRLLDVASALVEAEPGRPLSAPAEVGPPVGGRTAEPRRTP